MSDALARFLAVHEQIEGWFTHYKGPGEMVSRGFHDVARAEQVLAASQAAYAATGTSR